MFIVLKFTIASSVLLFWTERNSCFTSRLHFQPKLLLTPGFLSELRRHFDFYIHGSVHRDSILIRSNEMQQYAGVYLLHNYSTCFGCLSRPSSGVHRTVTAASGTGHSFRATTFRQRGLWPRWRKVVNLKL